MVEAPVEPAPIKMLQRFERLVDALPYIFEPVGTHHRYERQRENQRAQQCERHRVRHGMEQFSGSAAQRVDRNVAGNDDRDGVKNGPVDIGRCGADYVVELIILPRAQAQLAINVFDHHECAVDDDSKVDRADRKQVRVNAFGVQADEREEQRQRNCESYDDGGPHADQKNKKYQQDEQHAADQVAFNRVDGHPDQVATIVKWVNLYVRRQDVLVEVVGHCLDALQHVLRLFAAAHQDHAFDGVVRIHEAKLA